MLSLRAGENQLVSNTYGWILWIFTIRNRYSEFSFPLSIQAIEIQCEENRVYQCTLKDHKQQMIGCKNLPRGKGRDWFGSRAGCYFCTLSPETNVSYVQIECDFLLLHGFKSNVRHNRPDLTSTQEDESHTVTRTGSQYNIKQRNNFLGKRNVVSWRNTWERAQ